MEVKKKPVETTSNYQASLPGLTKDPWTYWNSETLEL